MSLLKLNMRKKDNNETFKLFLLNLINDIKEYEMKEILNKKKYVAQRNLKQKYNE